MTHMDRALELARRAVGSASPNPAVGAVVVRGDQVIGEGWTQPPGGIHAEAMALAHAGPNARGATLYVTLEPCSHVGKTPACTEAIIDAGIAEVNAAMQDPNPCVSGGGLLRLRDAGIRTQVGEGLKEAGQLVEAYVKFVTSGRPFVTAKFAMSLDGKIATRAGDSKWITGQEARRYVHQLRAACDAIVVGVNTVITDDPQLTARDDNGHARDRQPLRVIIDSTGRIPPGARLLTEPGRTLLASVRVDRATRDWLTEADVEILSLPSEGTRVDIERLLEYLGQLQKTSVLVEGGGTLLGSFFDLGLVDKVVALVAPAIFGGGDAPSPVAGLGVEKIAHANWLDGIKIMNFGPDIGLVGYC